LGVDYKFLRDNANEIYLEATMSKKVHDIVQFFEDVTGEIVTMYDTPGIPGSVLKTHEGDTIRVDVYRTSTEVNVLHIRSGFEAIECGKGLIKTHGKF